MAQEMETNDILRNPALSSRCRYLLKERNQKIQFRLKLEDAQKKNNQLLSSLPPEKQSVKLKLSAAKTEISHEISLASLRIKNMEETIIKSGCPGIAL